MVIISLIEFAVCGTIYFVADKPVIFVIENLLVACCLSGTFTMITPLFKDIFGDLGTEMYGLTGFFIGLASFTGPILTKTLIKEDSDYLKVYLIGGAVCVVKFIALLFFDQNSKFKFKVQIKEEDNDDEAVGITTNRPTTSV
jgi:hypothetical protein